MTTGDHEEQEIGAALRKAFPETGFELRRDLWPAFQKRLETPAIRVPWYDWALAAGVLLSALVFPKLVFFVMYHF